MQPLTTAVWDFPNSEDDEDVKAYKAPSRHLAGQCDQGKLHCPREKAVLNNELMELSDIISIHCTSVVFVATQEKSWTNSCLM